ncbi:unnamed protein product [Pleuronectes platessa]|uniref:Uncharacterized protein n=1 Tax=Pleuronectes platessa TaxID=8262 RepID=A0A9N7Z3I0_PLEPL|nr:unnamed protein product [Pleuronectes platessa]
MQMGQTGDRTADLQVGGRPLYSSATAAHTQKASGPPSCGPESVYTRTKIQGLCCRTMDYDLWIVHQRSQWWIQFGRFYIVRADRSGNKGSCVALASDNGGGPGPMRRLMMDPNKQQWTMTLDYSGSDQDDGS